MSTNSDYGQEALEWLNEMGNNIDPSFVKAPGEIPSFNKKQDKADYNQIKFPHYNYSQAFYDVNPSPELIQKEKERQAQRMHKNNQKDNEVRLLEEVLCKKYNIKRPNTLPNTMKNGNSTKDTQILCIGDTIHDRRNRQTWGITQEARTRHSHIIGPSGSGKALKVQEYVLAEKGWTQLKDLEIGDKIYTRNGTLAPICGIYPQGKLQVWEIEFADGQVVECSGDHLWIVERKTHGTYKEFVKTTEELYNQGVRTPQGTYRNGIPLVSPIQWNEKNLPIHPYVLGLLIGDGCLSDPQGQVKISTGDQEIVDNIEEILGRKYHLKHYADNYEYVISEFSDEKQSFTKAYQMRQAIDELKLNLHAHEKFIPDIYKYGSVEQRYALLQGLLDSDGTAREGRISFFTTSERLKDDIRYLLNSLGIENHVSIDHREYAHSKCGWSVSVFSKDIDNLFMLTRKKEDYRQYRDSRKPSFEVYKRKEVIKYDNNTDNLIIPPYVLGVILRGRLNRNTVEVTTTTLKKYPEILDYIRKDLNPEFLEATEKPNGASPSYYDFFIDGGRHKNGKRINALLQNVRELDLNVTMNNRFIPHEYLYSSPENRQLLLQGLLDYDGNIHGRRIEFHSKSPQMIKDMETLLTSLGYDYEVAEVAGTTEIRIKISDANLFRVPARQIEVQEAIQNDNISADGGRRSTRNKTISIIDIRPTDRYEEMQCIRVDDPSASFIIEGFKVTHNSTFLHQLLVQDLWFNRGGLLLEPHGDLAEACLFTSPPYRIHDVIYLNVMDLDYSPGINPLELPEESDDPERTRTEAIGKVVTLISQHFNMDEKMALLKKNLQYALQALSYTPGATLLEIMDFYTNPDVQQTILSFMPEGNLKDSVQENAINAKSDALSSLENRISQFTTNRFMRHLFGQSHSTIDFYEEMNRGAMIICPVSKGGSEDNSFLKFYGSYIVSTVYKEALKRQSMEEADRIIFPLVIDEFQNFMTGDIEGMLAELRKYGLPLCLAHQYLDQLDKGIRASINNSCSTKFVYRLGSEDAGEVARWLSSDIRKVTSSELQSLEKYHVLAAPFMNGQTQPPFITRLFPPLKNTTEIAGITAQLIVERTHQQYMKKRSEIEKEILERKERLASGNKEAVIEMARRKNR